MMARAIEVGVLPIPKAGKLARGRIPSADAVAAHPEDAAGVFEDGIHRLRPRPGTQCGKGGLACLVPRTGIRCGEVVVVSPVPPMGGGIRRAVAAEHSG